MPSSVLVTGGCGFIGTWILKDLLAANHRVVVLDAGPPSPRWKRILGNAAARIHFEQGNLLDRTKLRQIIETHRVERILHLAALLTPACQQDPFEGCQVNVLGSVALFEEARRSRNQIQSVVYASSVAVYGDEPDHATQPTNDSGENRPETFYGTFKKSVELIAHQYWKHHRISSFGIRPQVAYGPERDVGMTAGPSIAARAAAEGGTYAIPYTGTIGYDYVGDLVRAFLRGTFEAPQGAVAVDMESAIASVDEVLEAILQAEPSARGRITIQGSPLPAVPPPTPQSISKVFQDWQSTSLRDGIRQTVDFYR